MKILVYILLFAYSFVAQAVTTNPTIWFNTRNYTSYNTTATNTFYSTPDAACQSLYDVTYTAGYTLASKTINPSTANTGGICVLMLNSRSGGALSQQSATVSVAPLCPAGSALDTSSNNYTTYKCTWSACPTNTTANASGQCIDNCASNKGQSYNLKMNGSSSSPSSGSQVCASNNCVASISTDFAAQVGGAWYGTASGSYTGASCSGQPSDSSFSNPTNANPAPADSAQTACIASGQSFGTVNGVVVCVPKTSSSATPLTTGSQSTTSTTSTNSAGVSVTSGDTVNTSVSVSGDTYTTVTTTTKSDGTSTQTTQTQSAVDYCASNPNSTYCKTSASSDTPTTSVCDTDPDNPACYDRGTVTDTDTISTSTVSPTFTPVTISSNASCPADRVFHLSAVTVTVPFSQFCTFAASLKPILMSFAYLAAAGIMFRGWTASS